MMQVLSREWNLKYLFIDSVDKGEKVIEVCRP